MTEAIEVVVGAQQCRFGGQCHSGLLGDLPCHRREEILFWIDAACGYLRPSVGMVSVLEHEKLSSSLDVYDNPLATLHLQIVRTEVTAELEPLPSGVLCPP